MNPGMEYRTCPCCGEDNFEVVFESNTEADDLPEAVQTVYMLPGEKWGRHVRCRTCHLIYVNPVHETGRINEAYSQRSTDDARTIRHMRLKASEAQVRLVDGLHHGGHLLDIGCGEGFFLYSATRAGYDGRGVELSRDAAHYARQEFGLDIEARPFEEVRFPENHFDVVTLWQVLEHVPYPLAILREAHRILKPDGLLALSTPNVAGVPARFLGKRWWNIRMLHINQFTAQTMSTMLGSAGFRNISRVSYRESISLLMLFVPVLRYLRLYDALKGLFCPDSLMGRVMNRIVIPYPSRLDNCTMIGVK